MYVCMCVCVWGSNIFFAAGKAEAGLECNQKKVQQITLTCCRPLFSCSQYLVIPPNCSGSSQIPLSTDPSNYSVCLHTVQWPHRTSPRSNYVFTGTRSRRWGICVILLVRSAARLKIPQNRTLIERQIETEGCVVGWGDPDRSPWPFPSRHQCIVKSYFTHLNRRNVSLSTNLLVHMQIQLRIY